MKWAARFAGVGAGSLAAFAFLWAFLCIVMGGPEGRVGQEAVIAGIISALLGAVFAWLAHLFYTAPQRVAQPGCPRWRRLAFKVSPLPAVAFSVLLFMVGRFVFLYFLMIAVCVFLLEWIIQRVQKH